jgi:hypothetical protein
MAVLVEIGISDVLKLDRADLIYFQAWARKFGEQWPSFSRWLSEFALNEMVRRHRKNEPSMISIPELRASELAEFLEATFVWRSHPQQVSAVPFVEALSMRVLARACTFLREADYCISLVEATDEESNSDEQ